MMYFKITFFIFSTLVGSKAYTESIASHADIRQYRDRKKDAIEAKKAELKTQLDVVGALAVLENDLKQKNLKEIEFSKLVLGMMTGHGYKNGVTSKLTANTSERALIEEIVKKAAAFGRNLNFTKDQIWYADSKDTSSAEGHANVLNDLVKRGIGAEPHYIYTPRKALPYQDEERRLEEERLRREEARRAEEERLRSIEAARRDQLDAQENYSTIITNAIAKTDGRYTSMLNELKRIGVACFADKNTEPADWIKTLVITFVNLNNDGKNLVAEELGNFVGGVLDGNPGGGLKNIPLFTATGALTDIQKSEIVLNLYLFLDENLTKGTIKVQKAQDASAAKQPIGQPSITHSAPNNSAKQWHFWNNQKHFSMPDGLNADEQLYVQFFMNEVMPKLEKLMTDKKIQAFIVSDVIRGASMGLTGMAEQDTYMQEFSDALDRIKIIKNYGNLNFSLDGVLSNTDTKGCLFFPSKKLIIAPEKAVKQNKRRFPNIDNGHAFFGDIGPKIDPITTFNDLHAEDLTEDYITEYKKLYTIVPPSVDQLKQLKQKYIEKVRERLMVLPISIRETFRFLIEKNSSDKDWVTFLTAFITNLCYNGTSDSIAAEGSSIRSIVDDKNNGSSSKVASPAKILAEMLYEENKENNNREDNDRLYLDNSIVELEMEKLYNELMKAQSLENPTAFLAKKTLKDYFKNADIIRNTVRKKLNGQTMLTDQEILKIIYWFYAYTEQYQEPPAEIIELFNGK